MKNKKQHNALFTLLATLLLIAPHTTVAQKTDKFKQLYEEFPTPTNLRTGAGGPGSGYWQQKADYVINLRLDDKNQRIYGEETITYTNNAPEVLEYLWLQLDQTQKAKDSDSYKISTGTINSQMSLRDLKALEPDFDGGFKFEYVNTME